MLEPLGAYLMIAQAQYENPACAGSYNVGPKDEDCITTGQLADLFCNSWGGEAAWEKSVSGRAARGEFPETGLLEDPYGIWLETALAGGAGSERDSRVVSGMA